LYKKAAKNCETTASANVSQKPKIFFNPKAIPRATNTVIIIDLRKVI
jgi:hypothetical protein